MEWRCDRCMRGRHDFGDLNLRYLLLYLGEEVEPGSRSGSESGR